MTTQLFLDDSQITVNLDEIQGDILIGLQKNAEVLVFFTITSPARFKTDLAAILGDVTYLRATKDIEDHKPGPYLGLNIAFSRSGLQAVGLVTDADQGALDPSFWAGAAASGPRLADNPGGDWLAAYQSDIHGVLLVTASGQQVTAANAAEAINASGAAANDQADALANALRASTHVVRIEQGFLRAAQPGHEHFGFADGISQPGVLGLTAPGPDPTQGHPGQDLVKPGEFVFGPYDNESGGQAVPPRPWMANGAYLVFRRLTQDVDRFNAFVAANAPGVNRSPGQLAAHLVGRWPDGSPVALSPDAPDPSRDASHPDANNDFEFGDADLHQLACPFAAHIRKTYPRDDLAADAAEKRRILRAGIPFGDDADADKGLLFICYQTSIVEKFEFIQTNWVNNPNFPFGKSLADGTPLDRPGFDLILGQPAPRDADLTRAGAPERLTNVPKWVTSTGAGYFFSPSKSTLAQIATP